MNRTTTAAPTRKELFSELERLTILCDNLRRTISTTAAEDRDPELVEQLRQFLATRIQEKVKLRKLIVASAVIHRSQG